MFMSIVPLSYAAKGFGEELTPPPELVIGEGEEWIPGAIDPFSISTYGEDDECRHHGQPSNYRYIGAVRGHTDVDILAVNLFTGVISLGIGNLALNIVSLALQTLYSISPGDELEGPYIKYQYIYNNGSLDPNMYWYHTFYQFETQDGDLVGNGCLATYSPEKPGDPFQD